MPNPMPIISVTSEISPAELLGRIQARFRELGRFGSPLTLTHNGEKYLAACDDQAFVVYRLVGQCHVSPGRRAVRSAWSPPRPWWMKPARPTWPRTNLPPGSPCRDGSILLNLYSLKLIAKIKYGSI